MDEYATVTAEPLTLSSTYIDDERMLALTLSVNFWGRVSTNPKTTPATERKVLETADKFYDWLTR